MAVAKCYLSGNKQLEHFEDWTEQYFDVMQQNVLVTWT